MNRHEQPDAGARPLDPAAVVAEARAILAKEIAGMDALAAALDGSLAAALTLVEARVAPDAAGRRGRLVVTGVGKSGHIGAKLASTFASTGTPSFYLHAAEAAHGDLGMVQPGDVVLAISRSGDSRELYAVLDYCRGKDIALIVMTTKADSPLGKAATVVLLLPEVEEVCSIRLAPTTSALITLSASRG